MKFHRLSHSKARGSQRSQSDLQAEDNLPAEDRMTEQAAAIVVQKHTRGWRTRARGMANGAFDNVASGLGANVATSDVVKGHNASHLFPTHGKDERLFLMGELEKRLDTMATSDWHEPLPGSKMGAETSTQQAASYEPVDPGDYVKIDIPSTLTSPRAPPSSKHPTKSFVTRLKKHASKIKVHHHHHHHKTPEEEAAARLPTIQAHVRGKLARAQLARDAQAVPLRCFTPGTWRLILIGPPCLLILLMLSPWLVPICLAIYIYLRLPYILGWILSVCVTRFAMFGYPIRFGALHLSAWLHFDKGVAPVFKLQLLVDDFALSNPPSLGCRSPDFVSVGQTSAIVAIDLAFISHLFRTGGLKPVTFHFESCSFTRARLIFELRKGQLNINGLVSKAPHTPPF
jgi:hypothetical protein